MAALPNPWANLLMSRICSEGANAQTADAAVNSATPQVKMRR